MVSGPNRAIAVKKSEYRKWHFDKSINLPFILSLALAVFVGFGYVLTQNDRLTKAETKVVSIEKNQSDLKDDLKDINKKLDRLIERSIK